MAEDLGGQKAFAATDDYSRPKYYALVEFPYPSGQGLHVGHPRSVYSAGYRGKKEKNAGLQRALSHGLGRVRTSDRELCDQEQYSSQDRHKQQRAHFQEQLKSLGYSFDWDREVNTTDPDYYKWTQWIFLKLFKAGLAYKAKCRSTGVHPVRSVLRMKRRANGAL